MILYFGLAEAVIGVREHHFGWQEGDVITTNGAKTEIYAIFEPTPNNMLTMVKMFQTLNTRTSMGCLGKLDTTEGPEYVYEELDFMLDEVNLEEVMVCNNQTAKKYAFKDYEKRLDFMEECVEQIS